MRHAHGYTPLVSIITPTLNRARLLPEAIQSVLKQTFHNWEHLIIDDGSTDNTEDVVRRFTDHRIIYVNRFKQRGISETRNLGIRLASGKYIAFLDSDDLWPANSLALRVHFLEKHPKLAFVFGQKSIYRHKGFLKELARVRRLSGRSLVATGPTVEDFKKARNYRHRFQLLLQGDFIPAGSVLVRKSIIDQVGGFDLALPVAEDYDLWLRIAARHDFALIDKILLHFRRFADSTSLAAKRDNRIRRHCRYIIQRKFKKLHARR